MSRLHKRLIVVFCLGVLLCGVGAGVAFTEFSALTYGGRQILGDPDMRTENFDVEFEAGEEARKVWGVGVSDIMLRIDDSVPRGTVRFALHTMRSVLIRMPTGRKKRVLFFSWYRKNHDDEMALMMEAKDVVLRNLKEGKIISVDTIGLEKVIVLVNSENEDDVRLLY